MILTSVGVNAKRVIAGRLSSVVLMYWWRSSLFARKPNACPKATEDMTSRVKYCATRPKSIFWKVVLVETYSRFIKSTRLSTQLSTSFSMLGISFPVYLIRCQKVQWNRRKRTYTERHSISYPVVSFLVSLGHKIMPVWIELPWSAIVESVESMAHTLNAE
jgi:hypothetical protein